jgi:putative methyltransferase
MSTLYSQASQALAPCLDAANAAKSSLKSRALQSDNKPATLALASETLRYRDIIDQLLHACGLELSALVENSALGYVLLYEFLFGQGEVRGGGGAKRALTPHLAALRQALVALKAAARAEQNADLLPESRRASSQAVPRYARVNTLKTRDFELVSRALGGAVRDEHLPYLLVVPPGLKNLHEHKLVTSGSVILQDKSSCFPAHALAQALKPSSFYPCDVLDATAAPGNKTTQLAALLGKGKVFAMDRNPARYELLTRRVGEAGADAICHTLLGDFLCAAAADARFANVRAILLDPSCSGSGTVLRNVDRMVEAADAENSPRVLKLAEFQLQALSHALSFPQVQLVSYSTCSVHVTENESVVAAALAGNADWELCECLPEWTARRGLALPGKLDEAQARMLARADPSKDVTGGFFVALFRRRALAASGPVAPSKQQMKKRLKKKRKLLQGQQGAKKMRADASCSGESE